MSEANIADLYRALELLRSDERWSELDRIRRANEFEPSLNEMADAVEARLLDQVLYEGNLAVFQRRLIRDELARRRKRVTL